MSNNPAKQANTNGNDSPPPSTKRYPKWFDPRTWTDFMAPPDKKKTEVSMLQEILQEADDDWNYMNNYTDEDNNYQSETSEERIPPTLRSPGVPLPPPSTRREGRGQPPMDDAEPPTNRMPLKFTSFRPSTNAPVQKQGQRLSIRREYEFPVLEEIFTAAEEEASDIEPLFENFDVREYNIDEKDIKGGHHTNKRRSNKNKHDNANRRRGMDQKGNGKGEKGDARRGKYFDR